MKGRKVPNLS